MSVALLPKNTTFSVYAYAANILIRFIDLMGMGPGYPFPPVFAAVKDCGKIFNGLSIVSKLELAFRIYKGYNGGTTYYSFNKPVKGGEIGVIRNKVIPEKT